MSVATCLITWSFPVTGPLCYRLQDDEEAWDLIERCGQTSAAKHVKVHAARAVSCGLRCKRR